MRLPEFTAGAALYRSGWRYYRVGTGVTTGAVVLPQQQQQLPTSCALLYALCNSGPESGNEYCTTYYQNCLIFPPQPPGPGGAQFCECDRHGCNCFPRGGELF
jgi:hypothetical protein